MDPHLHQSTQPANDPHWCGPGWWPRRLPHIQLAQKKPWGWGPVIQRKSRIPGSILAQDSSPVPYPSATACYQPSGPHSFLLWHSSAGMSQVLLGDVCIKSHSCQLNYWKTFTRKAGKLLSRTWCSWDSTGLREKGQELGGLVMPWAVWGAGQHENPGHQRRNDSPGARGQKQVGLSLRTKTGLEVIGWHELTFP